MEITVSYEQELQFQAKRRKATVDLIKIISELWYEKSIELVLFRNQLIDKTVSEILNLHEYAEEFVEKPISIFDTVEIAKSLKSIDLPPSRIDIGKLTFEYKLHEPLEKNILSFVIEKLNSSNDVKKMTPKDVVLFGFGRIGRLVAREIMTKTGAGNQLRLRAVVTRGKINKEILEKRASLLRFDSVHGDFCGTVQVDFSKKALIINGTTVYFISSDDLKSIDYNSYGIHNALLIDNTGVNRDRLSLSKHFENPGISKVILTAPGKEIPNIVYGVNHKKYTPEELDISSAASCTTNAITPVLKIIHEHLEIENGHLETIHAYTNDQNLVDNFHSKYRRGRAAGLNMVITETGAGKAVAKALPVLTDKLTSNAIRVPVPNGSLAILNLNIKNATTLPNLNEIVKKAALNGDLVEQIKYEINDELVSSDIVGSAAPSIYDSKASLVSNEGKNIVIYVWYDNEYGYSHQVVRLAKYVSNVRRFTYY